MDLELLRERERIIRGVREFFHSRSYLEVDTPLLAPDLIPESCLEVFETERVIPAGAGEGRRKRWLIPSPEIWMKRLIAAHKVNIFQVCRCFRNGESSGGVHSPEFTMLEFYTMGADYRDSLAITEALFAFLGGPSPFKVMTMDEAFRKWAGFGLLEAGGRGAQELEEEARRLGIEPPPGLGEGALFDLIFVHAVEPRLREEGPLALTDYPAFVPCLARKGGGGLTSERWELYCRGLELANCYTEETSPEEVRRFFASEAAAKQRSALVPHAVDGGYWKIFRDFPPCSGVALGLDRLVMTLTARSRIDSVLPFAEAL